MAVSTSDGSEGGPYGARYLVERRNADARGWRSQSASLLQELVFALCESVTVARATFRHLPASLPESWAREVELYLSIQPPEEDHAPVGRAPVGRWTLALATDPQEFVFPPTAAQYIRLRILSRHGDAAFTSLGTFALGSAVAEPSSKNPPGLPPPRCAWCAAGAGAVARAARRMRTAFGLAGCAGRRPLQRPKEARRVG